MASAPAANPACNAAVLGAGAGRYPYSNYTECCWTTGGAGQFRPGDAANPHLGTVGQLEHIAEVRVETPCVGKDIFKRAVEALRRAHPYEEPSFQIYKLENFGALD
ncbi:structural toxin protein (hemagglutinin/hemolysin) RtxA [Microdochium nivale]|nr:structural toxin protein (hemagglutinin/hemolysin) RtxA [Microdochium nivale]